PTTNKLPLSTPAPHLFCIPRRPSAGRVRLFPSRAPTGTEALNCPNWPTLQSGRGLRALQDLAEILAGHFFAKRLGVRAVLCRFRLVNPPARVSQTPSRK